MRKILIIEDDFFSAKRLKKLIMDIDDNGEAHFTINYLEDNEIVQRPGQQISEWGMQRQ